MAVLEWGIVVWKTGPRAGQIGEYDDDDVDGDDEDIAIVYPHEGGPAELVPYDQLRPPTEAERQIVRGDNAQCWSRIYKKPVGVE